MRTVIKRIGEPKIIDGFVHYNEEPSTYEEAESICKLKLDRRKNYCIIDGEVHESASATVSCSGCSCDCGCCGSHGNAGCDECGYTGKRVDSWWHPVLLN